MISSFIHVSGLLSSLSLEIINKVNEMSQALVILFTWGHLSIHERVCDIKVVCDAKNEAKSDLDDTKLLSGNRRIGRLFKFALHVFIQDDFSFSSSLHNLFSRIFLRNFLKSYKSLAPNERRALICL